MKHTLIAIGCALALASGSAVAQQDTGKSQSSTSQSGGGFVEKTKDAFHKLGESVKNGFHKAGDKVDSAKAKDKDGTKSMGAGAAQDKDASTHDRQQRMDSAYDDYKNKSPSERAKK